MLTGSLPRYALRTASIVAASAVTLATAACRGDGGQESLPASDQRSSVHGGVTGGVLAQTDLGALPVPATITDLKRRAFGMPDALNGARRAPGPPEQVAYVADAGVFGIEVSDAEDLYPGLETTRDVFTRLREQLTDPRSCGQPPSYCLRGGSEGQTAVIWGHDQSPLVFVARAADDATLTDLLTAWRAGG